MPCCFATFLPGTGAECRGNGRRPSVACRSVACPASTACPRIAGSNIQCEVHEVIVQAHHWFLYYLVDVAAISLVTGLLMKETLHSAMVR